MFVKSKTYQNLVFKKLKTYVNKNTYKKITKTIKTIRLHGDLNEECKKDLCKVSDLHASLTCLLAPNSHFQIPSHYS